MPEESRASPVAAPQAGISFTTRSIAAPDAGDLDPPSKDSVAQHGPIQWCLDSVPQHKAFQWLLPLVAWGDVWCASPPWSADTCTQCL